MIRIATFLLAAAIGFGALTSARAQSDPERSITLIAGDLYRFQNKFHYSVLLVTPNGVIVTDPVNGDAARWLKGEIARRFDKPVRYVIYSHDHVDHSSGGEVFAADGAVVIAHEKTKAVILGEARPTAVPDITFNDNMTVTLGGKTVRLMYLGKNHSDNMIVMLFPDERTLYAVDFIPVKTVAYKTLSDGYLPDWINSLKRVERLDFDILAPGHGPIGVKADVAAFRNYMSDLYNGVLAAVRAGKSLAETKAAVDLSAYKSWEQFDAWSPLNIEGAYERIMLHRRGN